MFHIGDKIKCFPGHGKYQTKRKGMVIARKQMIGRKIFVYFVYQVQVEDWDGLTDLPKWFHEHELEFQDNQDPNNILKGML